MRRQIVSLLIGCFTVSPALAGVRSVDFNIQAESAETALAEFGQQSGLQTLYTHQAVAGLKTAALTGNYEPSAALDKLLRNTGLTYKFADDHTVTILPVAHAAAAHEHAPDAQEPPAKPSDDSSSRSGLRLAQAPAGSPQTPAPVSNETSGAPILQEVLVTAQKRSERLQDVPISMGVVTADDIKQRGLVGAEDFLRGMPGVNQMAGPWGETIIIRGIETSPTSMQNFGSGTTVATYFGETPTTSSTGLSGGSNIDIKLVDIERVEVLRGPQGTAFGDASLGGAVRTIPVAPKLNIFEGSFSAGSSDTARFGGENNNVQAVINLPLIDDHLAIRAVGYVFNDSGYIRNVAATNPTFQAYSAANGLAGAISDENHVGDSRFIGGRIAALYQATDDLKFTATFLRQTTELDGSPHTGTLGAASAPYANLGPYEQALWNMAPEQVVHGQALGIWLTNINLSNATMEYNLGWGNLLATVSYIESGATTVTQLDFGPYTQRGVGPHTETDGEIRFASTFSGPVNFLAGLYGQKARDTVLFDYWWIADPTSEQALFNTTNRDLGIYADQRELRQKAAYGELSYKFLEHFTLTGGVRTYDYSRSDDVETTGPIFGTEDSPSNSTASRTSWKGNLSYKPLDNTMIYATWSEGFRLGKPQPGLPQPLCGDPNGIVKGTEGTTNVSIASTRVVNSDTVQSYELGTKLSLLDRRLSISADIYRMNWDGLPFSVNAPSYADGGCGLIYVANAGTAKSQGFELETHYYLTPVLRLDAGGSLVDATLTQDAPSIDAVAGDRLPGSPRVNANIALQYAFIVTGHDAWVRADSTYVGPFFGDLQSTEQTKAGGYTLVGLAAGISVNKNLSLKFDARNLTNQSQYVWRNNIDSGPSYGYPLRPRTLGIQADCAF